MKKIILLFSILLGFSISSVTAASFQASAPDAVAVGQPFRLVYSVNASNVKDLRAPEMNGFDVLAGPFESRSSSVQIVNGQVNSSSNISYTYTLMPKKEGTFSIPAASIYVDNQRLTSNALTIKVLPADKQAATSQAGGGGSQRSADAGISQKLSNDNVFIRAIPSKTRLFEQDYLLITYKLYTLADVVGFSSTKFPDFNGFLKQEIPLPQNKQLKLESYNGRNYSTVVLYQALLYPQQSGTITVDPANVEAIIRVKTRAQVRSIFDDFFATYQDVKKMLTTPAIKINVDKLPSKPADFSGGVGSFSFKSSISTNNVNVNDAITLRYTISGNGNLKLVKNPVVEFPSDFEVYDPKVNNNFKNTTSGVNGTKTVEYLLIPRSAGDFTIPAFTFNYFDVNSKSYKTINTQAYKIHVNKGSGGSNNQAVVASFTNQEQLKVLGKDIRYIDTELVDLSEKDNFIFGSLGFWLAYLIPLIIAIVVFILYRKQLKQNADISSVKNRKANSVAIKRLKTANKYLLENKKEQFYDEVMRALWGYLSDKLSIPVSNLSKDNVSEVLQKHKIEDLDIAEFMDVLSVCEFARYAPPSDTHAMDNLYERAISIISKFQQNIK